MKIWFVNHYALPPGASGGPTRHLGLARALAERGHDVTVVASVFDHYSRQDHSPRGDGPMTEDVDGVTYVWIPTPAYESTAKRIVNMTSFALQVVRKLGGLGLATPDVVVGSSPHLLAPLAAERIARRVGAVFVMEVRDIWPDSLVDLGDLSRRHPAIMALRAIEGHLYRAADEVVTVLPHASAHLVSRGADPAHLHVIPNGVAIDDEPLPAVPHEGLVAVYAGTMGVANGLDVVIDAGEVLQARRRDDITIRLVGSGPEHARLAARAAALPNVSVEPAVPSDEIRSVLAVADVGLLTLRDSPVFRWGISPTKLFDYMAAGLPVIVSVRSPGDPASDAGAALRAEPGDAVSLADALVTMASMAPAERHQMGERGRSVAREVHSFDALAARYESLVETATATRA